MPTIINSELLSPYFKAGKVHKGYVDTVKSYNDLKVHVDGEYPVEIIDKARPNEPTHIKEYRKTIFAHITMPTISKVITSLNKIRKSEDWNIKYDFEKVNNPMIRKGENLFDYMEMKFPYFASATNWLFSVFSKQYLTDANAVICVMPLDVETASTDYRKPFPVMFNSPQVMEYVENDYCILRAAEKASFKIGEMVTEGESYYVVNTQVIQKWDQDSTEKGFTLKWEIIHGFGEMPAWRVRGLSWKTIDRNFIWKSRISSMVPFLNEAVREYSDLQAGVVQHLFLERWEYEGGKCKMCSGTGKVKKDDGLVKCPNKQCDGGTILRSPYQTIILRKGLPGEAAAPNPPAGYIDRNPEIIKLQDERVDRHNYKALAAVNMEFLSNIPLAQSGVAKTVDREETNNFANGVAEDEVANLDKVYYFSAMWRYLDLLKKKELVIEMLPKIPVPEKYDLFTSAYLVEELSSAKNAKVNPALIKAMEVEYAAKKFNYDADVKIEVELVLNLDPLPGASTDEKASMLMNKGVSEEDYIVSCNVSQFVKRALEESDKFIGLPHAGQLLVLRGYAGEIKKANSAAEEIKTKVIGEDDSNGGGVIDATGKLPLALQQLALARERADNAGDKALSNQIAQKMRELLKDL